MILLQVSSSEIFDVIIVGAGPAGLVTGWMLSEHGVHTIILEKDKIPGRNKPCGGALTSRAKKYFSLLKGEPYIEIRKIKLVFPNGESRIVEYDETVMINIERERLARVLIRNCQKNGCTLLTSHKFVVAERNGNLWDITVKNMENNQIINLKSKILVGADGVLSQVNKTLNIRSPFKKDELGLSVQYLISRAQVVRDDANEFYYGHQVSPFGYAWIFPHTEYFHTGVGALLSKIDDNLRGYLDRFIPSQFKKLNNPIFQAALVPLSGLSTPSYTKAALLVGDSAGHVLPITGEGIAYSMTAAEIAADIIYNSIKNNDFSAEFFRRYEKKWISRIGSDLRWGKKLMLHFLKKGRGKSKYEKFLKDQRFIKMIGDIIVGTDKIISIIRRNWIAILKYYFS